MNNEGRVYLGGGRALTGAVKLVSARPLIASDLLSVTARRLYDLRESDFNRSPLRASEIRTDG